MYDEIKNYIYKNATYWFTFFTLLGFFFIYLSCKLPDDDIRQGLQQAKQHTDTAGAEIVSARSELSRVDRGITDSVARLEDHEKTAVRISDKAEESLNLIRECRELNYEAQTILRQVREANRDTEN